MSSRRKKAPPVRVDEEAKRRLEWNMLEDRKNEENQEDDPTPACAALSVDTTPSSSFFSATEDMNMAACSRSVQFSEELPSASTDSASTSLALSVLPSSTLAHIWKALIGEFNIRPTWLPADCEQRVFVLFRRGEQLHIGYSSCEESSGHQWRPDASSSAAECSLCRIPLEDLDWLQKRRVLTLCHHKTDQEVKVRAFLLRP